MRLLWRPGLGWRLQKVRIFAERGFALWAQEYPSHGSVAQSSLRGSRRKPLSHPCKVLQKAWELERKNALGTQHVANVLWSFAVGGLHIYTALVRYHDDYRPWRSWSV